MIQNEYLRFVKTLTTGGVSNDVRKLANIVFNHIDEIAPLGTASGRRVKKIVDLAQKNFKNASSEYVFEVEDPKTNTSNSLRLTSLTVGPFRGFAKSEEFDLDSQIVLIYGPNGTGKSSFCEALEYGLLGSVEEAESKRFRGTRDYLRNVHVNRFVPPLINVTIEGDEPDIIKANEAKFRFCFIEKNRIDSFSRIAANTPARQTELISILFGLESFNEFVRGFSTDIYDRYLDLIGVSATELAERKQALEGSSQSIIADTNALVELAIEEQSLAEQYQKSMSFADFVLTIGTTEQPGQIQALENDLQQVPPTPSGLKQTELIIASTALEKAITDLQSKESELAGYCEGLSYKNLYQAVICAECCKQRELPGV